MSFFGNRLVEEDAVEVRRFGEPLLQGPVAVRLVKEVVDTTDRLILMQSK